MASGDGRITEVIMNYPHGGEDCIAIRFSPPESVAAFQEVLASTVEQGGARPEECIVGGDPSTGIILLRQDYIAQSELGADRADRLLELTDRYDADVQARVSLREIAGLASRGESIPGETPDIVVMDNPGAIIQHIEITPSSNAPYRYVAGAFDEPQIVFGFRNEREMIDFENDLGDRMLEIGHEMMGRESVNNASQGNYEPVINRGLRDHYEIMEGGGGDNRLEVPLWILAADEYRDAVLQAAHTAGLTIQDTAALVHLCNGITGSALQRDAGLEEAPQREAVNAILLRSFPENAQEVSAAVAKMDAAGVFGAASVDPQPLQAFGAQLASITEPYRSPDGLVTISVGELRDALTRTAVISGDLPLNTIPRPRGKGVGIT